MITIYLRRYTADITIISDKIIESNQRTESQYTETTSTMNVGDINEFRQEFIRSIGRKVYNQNRSAELKAIRTKAKKITKVIVYKVQ